MSDRAMEAETLRKMISAAEHKNLIKTKTSKS